MSIADRLTAIRQRLDAAARSAGRDPASVRLVAVSKTFPVDAIRDAWQAGQREFGENRVPTAWSPQRSAMSIAARRTAIRQRLDAAARSAGRDPASGRLVAASKTFPVDAIRDAWQAGQREFGENRVQEALQKISASA